MGASKMCLCPTESTAVHSAGCINWERAKLHLPQSAMQYGAYTRRPGTEYCEAVATSGLAPSTLPAGLIYFVFGQSCKVSIIGLDETKTWK